ncbi:hypothetical protein NEAUS04_1274 [Nematocida ausubeli]|uniref:Uncharacterized protein n=1 Tax=Nematocida ausubeli (strain ATCC PRA-371 / ERTm2) TaxID=1913371 RepID=H8ZA18_NEMA1|nr:uncharacterized protein NESG_00669 [Nematocida ausubeli]EHY66799.1 hypothetical protein NERG_00439 [Nematocida ausubeli]KAI5132973.1 hypothetical protein NEAUS06_0468 [Nematocida ausubeli]KAI5162964.1 hypothetical protein NEAUS04_1274 [Nematocida ausubeli]KFG26521.1 hypothetical protein NESG_00669 [Nematocida ausubeli]
MRTFLESRPEKTLAELQKEVLSNIIYYIDTKYHEISRRNQLDDRFSQGTQQDLEEIQKEIDEIHRKIGETQEEVNLLQGKVKARRIDATVDLNLLLQKVAENASELKPQKTIRQTSPQKDTIYSVNFINTEITEIPQDKIDLLDKIKHAYR